MQSSKRSFVGLLAVLAGSAVLVPQVLAQATATAAGPHRGAGARVPLGLEPSGGGPGTVVAMGGAFGPLAATYLPDDVRATNNEVEDEQFFWGRCVGIGTNYALLRVDETNDYARPKEVELTFGSGHEMLVPSLDGVVFYPEPIWAWTAPPNAPSIVSTEPFAAPPLFVDEPCGEPPTTIRQPFELEPDGCLHVQLPGTDACIGDRLGLELFFETNLGSVAVTVPLTTPLASTTTWSVAGVYLLFPLSIGLTSSGCTATLDPVTRQLVVCPGAGVTISSVSTLSSVTIELDPLRHTQFTALKGDRDGFHSGDLWDPTLPSAEFALVAPHGTNPSNGGLRDYDDGNSCDRFLVDTVDPLGVALLGQGDMGSLDVDGPIRSAVLEVRIRGYGCQTYTDAILFGWDGVATGPGLMEWGSSMTSLSALSFQWRPNDDATLCFDLGALPGADGRFHSILDIVTLRDALDVVIADDTEIDYVELKVLRCTP